MCNALGIINYDDASAYVEGLQDYRPMQIGRAHV